MHEGESARSVFEVLYTRWPTAPEVVVYDNACNLAIYAHMREAYLFKDTTFVIDRLHQHAHHQCSPVFDFNLYSTLYGKNSQLAEQFWSR